MMKEHVFIVHSVKERRKESKFVTHISKFKLIMEKINDSNAEIRYKQRINSVSTLCEPLDW